MANRENVAPLSEMTTTPLIDVLLVLLIMFVITIPVATHSVDVDVGQGPQCHDCPLDLVKNRVTITVDDKVRWNETPVTNAQLAALLKQSRALPVEPELQFEPDHNASYRVSAQTLATIQGSGVTKFGFVGNERYRQFASR